MHISILTYCHQSGLSIAWSKCCEIGNVPKLATTKIFCLGFYLLSVSSRISKGQGYQGFLTKEKGSEQSWPQKRQYLRRTMKNLKNGQISLLLGSIKCFPISFSTFWPLLKMPRRNTIAAFGVAVMSAASYHVSYYAAEPNNSSIL
jgi:hypothetical protein